MTERADEPHVFVMKIKTLGRKVNLKDNFIRMVERKLNKFDRFFDDDAEAQVTVRVENIHQTVEITIKSKGIIYRSERSAVDMESAFNEAAELIGRQIIKNKGKLGARIKRTTPGDYLDYGFETPPEDEAYRIVRKKNFEVKPMTVQEAILRMNMLSHTFYIFLDEEVGSLCVVYRRDDDDYGLLIPEME